MGDPARFVVVHGHFYQPPREDPWLESVPREASAAPYHDWNERITAECYAANANARRLDGSGRIVEIVNNYRRIGFNFGPTLLSWLERAAPETYAAVIAADRESASRLRGHGPALAQAYNHVILPLAGDRDKRTQVRWGRLDFEHRFGRPADGMWLPETAVDVASLEALAAEGIRFTVLAPHQARRVRPLASPATGGHAGTPPEGPWRDAGDGSLDTRQAYLCRLPSGRSIAIFFYDAELARAVAFDGALHSGDGFADRVLARFDERAEPQLVHLATDGESYGHHHRFGEMALAAALRRLADRGVQLTSYGAFLAAHPPLQEVEIAEATSWSCAHGVERWRASCGCRAGADSSLSQEWRAGLRAAFDALARDLDRWFEAEAGALVGEPWALRDEFGSVLVDPARTGLRELLTRHAIRPLSEPEVVRLARLLECQRARLLMFTSCGWFFDELTGLEGTQVLRYAARALELAREQGFTEPDEVGRHLASARSNHPERGTAADVLHDVIAPRMAGPRQVAVAAVIERLIGLRNGLVREAVLHVEFEPWLERTSDDLAAGSDALARAALGVSSLTVGVARVRDSRTLDERAFVVAAHRHGGLDVLAAARPTDDPERVRCDSGDLVSALDEAFARRAHGALVVEMVRRLGPEVSGLEVMGDASRAAFFPAIVADVEAIVAHRLAELAPLARAVAEEARSLGATVPAVISAALEAVNALQGDALRDGDVDELVRKVELALTRRAISSGSALVQGIEGLVRAIRSRMSDSQLSPRSSAHLSGAQERAWWHVWARSDVPEEARAALAPLVEALGFSPEAPRLAAREAAFASLVRVVREEIEGARQGVREPHRERPAKAKRPAP